MQPILLLHGAIGASDQLLPLKEILADSYNVHTLDFSGHGGQPFPQEPFSIGLFAKEVVDYLDKEQIQSIDIFGYSMGGYVALYMAKHYPDRVGKIVTLATKFYWDVPTAEKESKMMNALVIKEKVPAFAATLAKRHAPNSWEEVLEKTKEMLQGLGEQNAMSIEDYKLVNNFVLILIGDKDKMVTLEETLDVYKNLPNAHMGVLPNTQHPIEQVDIGFLGLMIKKHFS
ncbi:MAG: alpha/beta fold hydrolase [Flavipsychrobacter sp.]